MTQGGDFEGFPRFTIAVFEPSAWPRKVRVGLVALAAAALVLHAQSFHAVCDDAFISLRHAQNLALHGAPVYNLGERVEGFTNPLWVWLSALAVRLGVRGREALTLMADLGAVALVLSTWQLWHRTRPGKPLHGALVLALVVGSAPVAAWTSSGLETPLFAALVALSLGEVAALSDAPSTRRAAIAGGLVALATLTRPEGALLGLVLFGWLVARTATRRAALPFAATALVPLLCFELWRYHYYGALLPNTYAAKVSASVRERLANGLWYAWFSATEMGLGVSGLLLAALAVPTRVTVARIARFVVLVLVAWVIWVGGDFLDLFRFFVPILPVLFVVLVSSAMELVERLEVPWRAWLAVVVLALPAYGYGQYLLRQRALSVKEPTRKERWIEPLGWTRLYGYVWADVGKFIKSRARPGDVMAAPAAGAAPYYAEIPNIDLFGLADAEVAKHGHYNGPRPGHQRFASLEYVLKRHPTFIMLDECALPSHWASWKWTDSGYECVITQAPTSTGGHMRLTFLLDKSLADELGRQRIVYRLRRP